MAEYEQTTVPNPTLQDVVLMDFACNPPNQVDQMKAPLTCPDKGHPGLSAFEQAWADQPAFLPVILNVGKQDSQQEWWSKKREATYTRASGVGSAIKLVIQQNSKYFPSGVMPGRIAAIGFSQGCSGIAEMLRGSADADATDFVYACDGMHGQINPQTNAVYVSSLDPWINFALKAAQGKTMMVVTHTEIIPFNRESAGVASTAESAAALLSEVKKRLGYTQVAPRMIPRGLVGQDGFAPTPPDGTSWSSWVNKPSGEARVLSPWPVKYYEILGNLIVVGFNANTTGDPSPPSSSQSAHVFQAWWVMRQVIMEVLACRWAAKCDTVNVTDGTAGLGATPIQRSHYIDPRFPSVIQRPNPAMLRHIRASGKASLGATSSMGGCLVEGHFSRLFSSPSEMRAGFSGALSTASPAELLIGALGLGIGGYALYKHLTRNQ